MKIKQFITTMVLCSFLTQPLIAFADPNDPILGLMNNGKTNNSNSDKPQAKSNTAKVNSSPNPDDDDPEFPTDDKPKDNNFSAMNNGSDAVTNMLLQSVSLMGIRYKWGGNSPASGMDCSGFVRYVYQKSLGITLPRTAAEQAKVGKRVSINDLQPGDLMFFNSRRGSNTHVGMYLGNNKFIQSPRTGDVIKISEFTDSWRSRFNGAKRIVQDNSKSNNSSDDTSLQNLQSVRDEPLPVSYRAKSTKNSHSRKSSHKGRNKSSTNTTSHKSTSGKPVKSKTSAKSTKSSVSNKATSTKSNSKPTKTKKKKS